MSKDNKDWALALLHYLHRSLTMHTLYEIKNLPEAFDDNAVDLGRASSVPDSTPDIAVSSRLTMAVRRSISLIIDYSVVFLIFATPGLYRILTGMMLSTHDKFLANFAHAAVHHGLAATIFFFLLATPIPLIFLRIAFRTFSHQCTPGEALTGITMLPERGLTGSYMREIKCAMAQYLTLICVYVITLLTVQVVIAINSAFSIDFVFAWLILNGLTTSTVFLHFSFSRSSYKSLLDRCLGIKVSVLKSKTKSKMEISPISQAKSELLL